MKEVEVLKGLERPLPVLTRQHGEFYPQCSQAREQISALRKDLDAIDVFPADLLVRLPHREWEAEVPHDLRERLSHVFEIGLNGWRAAPHDESIGASERETHQRLRIDEHAVEVKDDGLQHVFSSRI